MKRQARKVSLILLGLLAGWLGTAGPVRAMGEINLNYMKLPSFLESGLSPNLLLVIDNSASMYDPAYDDTTAPGYCNDDSYASASPYGGYFDPAIMYYYNFGTNEFRSPAAANQCTAAPGTVYSNADLCITINTAVTPAVVTAFAAKGNYLNWATASKFDIEKGILTGGKYDANRQVMVPESRGCQGKRMVKQVAVTKSDGTAFVLPLGVWPGAGAHDNLTRLEVFLPSTNGLQFAGEACEAALAATAFGQVQNLAGDCLMIGQQHESFTNSNAAFNHGFQSCWGYPSIGNGDITRMENACKNVYDNGVNPATIKETDSGYVCMGNKTAGTGYVGRCVEDPITHATPIGGLPASQVCTDIPCAPDGHPYLGNSNQQCTNGFLEECETGSAWRAAFTTGGCALGTTFKTAGTFYSCPGGYTLNAAQTACVGTPTCPVGFTLNAAQTACVITAGSCPVGYSLNAVGTLCEKWTCSTSPYTTVSPDHSQCTKSNGSSATPIKVPTYSSSPYSVAPTVNSVPPTVTNVPSTGCYDALNTFVGAPAAIINNPAGCYIGDLSALWVKKQNCVGSPAVPLSWSWVAGAGGAGGCIENALREYCSGFYSPDVIDPSSPNISVADDHFPNLPAILVTVATNAQLGLPLATLDGYVKKTTNPIGLLQEFSYNLRMGAMRFNKEGTKYECTQPTADRLYVCGADNQDGGRVISYIDDNNSAGLVDAVNRTVANSWTPMAEAMDAALGYYTQNPLQRLDPYDFFIGGTASFVPNKNYAAGSVVSNGGQWWLTKLGGISRGASPALDSMAGGISDWQVVTYPAWANNTDYSTGQIVTSGGLLYRASNGGTSNGVSALTDTGIAWVPYYDPVLASCQKNNILIITDGASTTDQAPAMNNFVTSSPLHNDGDNDPLDPDLDGLVGCGKYTGGTYLDDLAKYGASPNLFYTKNDFLDDEGNPAPKRSITTYVVAAGSLKNEGAGECNPVTLLNATADNGDMDDTKTSTFFAGEDPAQLSESLRQVFIAIGGEPASGSAASVISNSRSGEGAIYQAVFYPKQNDNASREIFWAGDVHALWLDDMGNIREDCGASDCTTQDFTLNLNMDTILRFYTDSNNSARARRYSDADGNSKFSDGDLIGDNIQLNELHYIWSAGEWLGQASAAQKSSYDSTADERYIFTTVDGVTQIPFTTAALSAALGGTYPGYFRAADAATADKIVNYIRGEEYADFRDRLIDWDENGTAEVWKLGDIVYSTPTVVAQPAEDYDLIYQDKSYLAFRQKYRDRRTMVYAGGNDGGLHAFNGGYYDKVHRVFEQGKTGTSQYDLGAEMWMFVPQNIWPHLQWLTDQNYEHIFYVDLKPYIFDAKVFTPDTDHPQGWGTILVGGMRFGGGNIGVDLNNNGVDDAIMRSSYFILDITNPEVPPVLLKEFTRPDLGMTVGAPTAIPMLRCTLHVDCPVDMPMDWYLAFPSGPHGADGDNSIPLKALNSTSNQLASIFIYPLGGTNAAGGLNYVDAFAPVVLKKSFNVADAATFSSSYFSDLITVDYDLDFKSDALYFGSVDHANNDDHRFHTGGVHRLKIDADPNPANWTINTFFETPGNQPVTAAPSVAWDGRRAWLYVGTGSYYSAKHDKVVTTQQSFYGLKEKFESDNTMLFNDPNGGNLVDVSDVWVENNLGTLSEALHTIGTPSDTLLATSFKELDIEMSEKKIDGTDKYHGWKLDFDLPGERNLGQAAILGNIVTFTTYVPSNDYCNPEGNSYLWTPYYRTGTSYFRSVMGLVDRGGKDEVIRKQLIGVGLATTPNIHSGGEEGTKAFVQTSTGAIISLEQSNPGVTKSGMQSWRELGN
jgi:Tfp pilus tip-associated adhesin PilY1